MNTRFADDSEVVHSRFGSIAIGNSASENQSPTTPRSRIAGRDAQNKLSTATGQRSWPANYGKCEVICIPSILSGEIEITLERESIDEQTPRATNSASWLGSYARWLRPVIVWIEASIVRSTVNLNPIHATDSAASADTGPSHDGVSRLLDSPSASSHVN